MEFKFLICLAVIALAKFNYALPVTTTVPQVDAEQPQQPSGEEVFVGTVFNYQVPTADELNPEDLDEESKFLQELQPPAIDNQVNFYEKPIKPKKGTKKYNKDEKWINKKPEPEAQDIDQSEEEKKHYSPLDFLLENIFFDLADHFFVPIGRAPAEPESETDAPLNNGEVMPNSQRRSDDSNDRIEYQMHGHQGPQSYRFGFDTERIASSDSRSGTTRAN